MMSGKKIFFADLDGSLLNSEKKITPATKQALDAFMAAGNYFVICTGRAIESAAAVKKELGFDYPHMFLVGYQGAHIYSCDDQKDVFKKGIAIEDVRVMQEIGDANDVYCQTYSDTHIIVPYEHPALTFYMRHIHTPLLFSADLASALTEDPCKVLFIDLDDHAKTDRVKAALSERFSDRYQFLYSNPWYLEVFSKEAGKGSAVRRVCDYLGLPIENSFAAGDEENDISMVEAAGFGIAMANGIDRIKAAADAVTEQDNDHDGLAPFIVRMTEG